MPPDVATGWLSGGSGDPPTFPSQLLADLTNIGKLFDVLGQGGNDPSGGSGHPNTPNVTGIGFGNLDNGGKPEFKDMIGQKHDVWPKH